MATTNDDISNFTGTWRCRYWFHNTKHDNREDLSEYQVTIEPSGKGFTLHSVSGKGELPGSQLEGRFIVEGDRLMGTWQENTSPTGEWMGMIYKGSFQLLLNRATGAYEGLGVTVIYNNGNPKVDAERWEIAQLPADAS